MGIFRAPVSTVKNRTVIQTDGSDRMEFTHSNSGEVGIRVITARGDVLVFHVTREHLQQIGL